MRRLAPALVVCVAASAAPLSAQSLFNAAGLGVPIEALDGRARALGSLGIGLPGGAFMPADPAALGRLSVSTGVMVSTPSWLDFEEEGGASGQFQGNRFPLLGIAYPILDGMMSVQIGSFLDQHYASQTIGSTTFGGETLQTTDDFEQNGSISNVNLGYARMLGENVSVGVTVGRYAGSVVRTLTRTYGDDETTDVDTYIERGEWSYTGHSVTTGIAADIGSRVRASASIQIPTRLDASATEGTRGGDRDFALPVQIRAGASTTIADGLLVAASIQRIDWSATQGDLSSTDQAGDANGFGVGVEFSRARLWGKDAPLRFGFRRVGLPFAFESSGAVERSFSAGLGLDLSQSGGVVLAGVDVAIERGRRSGMGLTEDFWRATISLLASGL